MLNLARRVAGVVVATALVAGLPLAAVRASCVRDPGHEHGAAASAQHECTSACTAENCAMHRRAAAATRRGHAGHADRREHARHGDHASPAASESPAPAAAPAAASSHDHDRPARAPREGVSCRCAGDAQALVGQATIAGVLPTLVSVGAPASTRAVSTAVAEAPLSLASSPPAPPPRA